MKRLRRSATINLILGFLSALALILQYFALADIAKEPNSVLEWRIVGVCMMILASFVVSTCITLGFALALREHQPTRIEAA